MFYSRVRRIHLIYFKGIDVPVNKTETEDDNAVSDITIEQIIAIAAHNYSEHIKSAEIIYQQQDDQQQEDEEQVLKILFNPSLVARILAEKELGTEVPFTIKVKALVKILINREEVNKILVKEQNQVQGQGQKIAVLTDLELTGVVNTEEEKLILSATSVSDDEECDDNKVVFIGDGQCMQINDVSTLDGDGEVLKEDNNYKHCPFGYLDCVAPHVDPLTGKKNILLLREIY